MKKVSKKSVKSRSRATKADLETQITLLNSQLRSVTEIANKKQNWHDLAVEQIKKLREENQDFNSENITLIERLETAYDNSNDWADQYQSAKKKLDSLEKSLEELRIDYEAIKNYNCSMVADKKYLQSIYDMTFANYTAALKQLNKIPKWIKFIFEVVPV